MCGVTGIFSNTVDLSVINNMTNSLQKRGPDGSGILYGSSLDGGIENRYFKPNEICDFKNGKAESDFALGHTRLAIIDTDDRSLQPMCCKNGRYWIVYNGEIFNYLEIKEELISAGYEFNTTSDTEVILNSFDYWGKDCLQKFNGMWAFSILDTETKNIFISRDRFGEKPLYYSHGEDFFIFGSEIKALFSSGLIQPEVKRKELARFLEKGPVEFENSTFFQHVFRLPAGHYVEFNLKNIPDKIIPIRYWKLRINTSSEGFNEKKANQYAVRYYQLLKDSVRLRIRSDVPIGSALSGGLDSSSIVYLIKELIDENELNFEQITFSCVYKDDPETKYCDESKYIELLVKELGITNYQITPRVVDIPSEHAMMIESFETPPENTCMSGWWTYKLVKEKNIKVTLDGQGADEQLTGYLYYYAFFLFSLNLRDFLREIYYCSRVPGAGPYVRRGAIAFAFRFLFGKRITSYIIKRVFGRTIPANLNEVLNRDFSTGLVNLFNNADRGSMAHSVESRMPYVDYRLVEFLASVPASYKIHRGWSKYLARIAFSGKLPDEICWRRDKMGWPIPEDVWFQNDLKEWIEIECSSGNEINEVFDKTNALEYSSATKKLMLRSLNFFVSVKKFGTKVVG